MLRTEWEITEYRLLCQAVREAARYAGEGDPDAGEACLREGLERALELERSGERWAEGLAASYRTALDVFRQLCRDPRASERSVWHDRSLDRRSARGRAIGASNARL